MLIRAVEFGASECAVEIEPTAALPSDGWVWIDIAVYPGDAGEFVQFAGQFGIDALAARDAVEDLDLPKVDDFGNSMPVVQLACRSAPPCDLFCTR